MKWEPNNLELWRLSFAWLGIFLMFVAGYNQSALLAGAACFSAIMSNQAAILYNRKLLE
jgi:hypothetical protein